MIPDPAEHYRSRVPNGVMHQQNIDPVQVRIPYFVPDETRGWYPRPVLRPAYARYLLNRMGGATLDPVAPNVKTPYPGPTGKGYATWQRVPAYSVPQHHKLALSTTTMLGPDDVAGMRNYALTFNQVRSRLSDIVQSLQGH